MTDDVAKIAVGLSEAQRRAILGSRHCAAQGVWHPEGFYVSADKRVRRNLVMAGIIRDYLRRSNRLTDLGLAVRAYLGGPQ